jgi:hypothetical protein
VSTDLSSRRCLVWDYGLFESCAAKLGESFGEVLYYVPWKGAYPGSNKLLIGEGVDNLTRVRDFFDHVDEADLIYFPDLGDGDLQVYLREKGKRVWGSGKGENLENFRWDTKLLMKKLGLPTAPAKLIVGIEALRDELKGRDNLWIKLSTFRADGETWHHLTWTLSEPRVAELEWRLGAKAPHTEFIVEDDIPNAQEEGYDGWNIDGGFPSLAMLGYEIKGSGLIGRVMPYEKLPDTVKLVNKKLGPEMKRLGYRGNFSSELRNGVLIDPCCRTPSPPGELYPEMYENYAECVWEGADGNLIDPIQKWKYGVEICVESDWSEKNWMAIHFPKEIEPFVKLRNYTKIDDVFYVLPMNEGPRVGAVIGLGNTLKEAVEQAITNAKQIEGFHIECDIESVSKGIKTITDAEESGTYFTDENDDIPSIEDIAQAVEA